MRNFRTTATAVIITFLFVGGFSAFIAEGSHITPPILGWIWGGTTEDNLGPAGAQTTTGLGWISMVHDNPNQNVSAIPYGVIIPASGSVTEFAWSPNVGWIEFQPTGPFPPGGTGTGVERIGNNLEGWARITSIAQAMALPVPNNGGFEGWIKMRGNISGGGIYGVAVVENSPTPGTAGFNGDAYLDGFAWSNEFGWIQFGPPNPPFPEVNFGTVSGSPDVSIAATDPSASEFNSDDGTFTITRSPVVGTPLTVNFTISGQATNDIDYQSIPNIVTIPPNAPLVNIIIDPKQDLTPEGDETVVLSLDPGSYNVSGLGNATVVIADDDLPSCGSAVAPSCLGSCPIAGQVCGVDAGGSCTCSTPSLAASCTGSPGANFEITWFGSVLGGQSPYIFSWNFLDVDASPSFAGDVGQVLVTYSSNGNKRAEVTVTDDTGASDVKICQATAVQFKRIEIPPLFF
ncbi:MAG: hypothetical protein AAB518_01925 [Patescibacteria group bacterium]